MLLSPAGPSDLALHLPLRPVPRPGEAVPGTQRQGER